MTKSTITREQLLEIIETDHVQCGEASYLARMALAAMDSETVAENIRIADALDGLLWPNMAIGNKAVIQAAIEALRAYHAQPAPVVLKDHQIRELVNQLRDIAIEYHGTQQLRERIAQAVRAAMLAAAPQSPGSEPATVPGKWIPVSEQMPENDGAYLCWDNRYVTTYAFIFGAWQANQFVAKNITHWMPLPAAPREVK